MTTVDSGSRCNLIATSNTSIIASSLLEAAAVTAAAAATAATDDVCSTQPPSRKSSCAASGDSAEPPKDGHDDIEPPLAYRELAAAAHDSSSSAAVHATREYLDQLFWDKNELRSSPAAFRHVTRLIDSEISRVVEQISSTLASGTSVTEAGSGSGTGSSGTGPAGTGSDKVVLQEKIFVPVDKYPRYNFVGRILGPRGMTAKQLEEETGCKIMVRGRGSCRTEPLHVLIHAEDAADRVEEKLRKAVERINQLLTPPPEGKDELKRKQLIELSIINGTYRPTTATKLALQAPRMPTSFSANAGSPTSGPLSGHSAGSLLDHSSALFSMLGDPSKRRLMGSDLSASSPHSPPASPRGAAPASLLDDNQAYLASLLAASNANAFSSNNVFSDYYRQLIAMSLADPSLLSYGLQPHDLLASLGLGVPTAGGAGSGAGNQPQSPGGAAGGSVPMPPAQYGERPGSATGYRSPVPGSPAGLGVHHHGVGAMGIGAGMGGNGPSGLIPPANMQQYLAAAAMLSGGPYLNDNNNNSAGGSHNNNHHHHNNNYRRSTLPNGILHDGSGDAQVAHMQAVPGGPPTSPMGGGVKRA